MIFQVGYSAEAEANYLNILNFQLTELGNSPKGCWLPNGFECMEFDPKTDGKMQCISEITSERCHDVEAKITENMESIVEYIRLFRQSIPQPMKVFLTRYGRGGCFIHPNQGDGWINVRFDKVFSRLSNAYNVEAETLGDLPDISLEEEEEIDLAVILHEITHGLIDQYFPHGNDPDGSRYLMREWVVDRLIKCTKVEHLTKDYRVQFPHLPEPDGWMDRIEWNTLPEWAEN